MAKKNKGNPGEGRAAADYYKLHARAVNDLINANEENSPPVSEEELRKYRSGPKLRLADWLKVVLIKMWFAGSVCFFIFWGLSAYLADLLDLLLVFAIALGVIVPEEGLLHLLSEHPLRRCTAGLCGHPLYPHQRRHCLPHRGRQRPPGRGPYPFRCVLHRI